MATVTDRAVGFGLVAFSLALFAYYTLWIVVLVRGRGGGRRGGLGERRCPKLPQKSAPKCCSALRERIPAGSQ
uniref:Dolichol phosphate-mannose biosynthesis regulatory protein n=1 Tax=Cairina moschata TaxID=8855 RepID=A0A8C3BYT1_CAIMO